MYLIVKYNVAIEFIYLYFNSIILFFRNITSALF